MRYSEYLETNNFTKTQLIAASKGTLVEDPPEGGCSRLPSPPFLMFDRITEVTRSNRKGRIVAEQDIKQDAWYFQCHFNGDPVQPGCLGVDALWQLLGFYCSISGAAGAGRALGCKEVEFLGQIRPYDKVVRYELEVKRFSLLQDSGSAVAIADGSVFVDDTKIYTVNSAKVGIFKGIEYSDYPNPDSKYAKGGLIVR